MKPRRHRARGRAAIVFPARGKKGKFGAIFLVLGLRRGWGGVLGLPTGVRAGDKISEGCTCRSARPRAAAPLQKFCAALGHFQVSISSAELWYAERCSNIL
jgi:hypothetical protein